MGAPAPGRGAGAEEERGTAVPVLGAAGPRSAGAHPESNPIETPMTNKEERTLSQSRA